MGGSLGASYLDPLDRCRRGNALEHLAWAWNKRQEAS